MRKQTLAIRRTMNVLHFIQLSYSRKCKCDFKYLSDDRQHVSRLVSCAVQVRYPDSDGLPRGEAGLAGGP